MKTQNPLLKTALLIHGVLLISSSSFSQEDSTDTQTYTVDSTVHIDMVDSVSFSPINLGDSLWYEIIDVPPPVVLPQPDIPYFFIWDDVGSTVVLEPEKTPEEKELEQNLLQAKNLYSRKFMEIRK